MRPDAYNKALSINPDYAEAYNNMGKALKDQGKLDEAIKVYNKALSIKSTMLRPLAIGRCSPNERKSRRGYKGLQQSSIHKA